MPRAVQRSINQFLRSLAEAVIIVLAVSLVSLGLRTGLVVAVSIPLVLAVTFLCMWLFGIGLHKISLGALILSLGLLVDDAIIAVEMMAIKLEQGFDRFRAASFAYTSTAFPMLTGTLVTVAGFLPIATAKSGTGEYTRSIFEVSAIALIASWVIAVVVIPYLGYRMLPDAAQAARPSLGRRLWARLRGRALPEAATGHAAHADVYGTPFYRALRGAIAWCVGHRTTHPRRARSRSSSARSRCSASCRSSSFPPRRASSCSSTCGCRRAARSPRRSRPPRGSKAVLAKDPGVESYVTYVGAGSPRFYLPLDQQLQQSNFAQVVLVDQGHRRARAGARPAPRALRQRLSRAARPHLAPRERTAGRVPGAVPRVRRECRDNVRTIAEQVARLMRSDPDTSQVQFDWDEPSKVIRVAIDQNKARVLGISSQELARSSTTRLSGTR